MEEPKRKTIKVTALLTFVLTCCLTSCKNQNQLPEWIIGKWSVKFTDYSVEESWEDKGDKFIGQTLWKGKLRSSREDIVMFVNEDDHLVYRTVVGERTTNFICKNKESDTLVFVNNANEFPKRLHYTKPSGNKMEVWIDNTDNDPNRIDFHFQKIE